MFSNRKILHVDMNAFYASVECLYRPEIRNLPVVVTGDPASRNGIVLAKNQIAKRYKIQTGEVIYQAKQKCPGLVCVKARHPLYARYSKLLRSILSDYSDRIESFGLDEAWVDITSPRMTWENAHKVANEIRFRSWQEIGITTSIGVSWNKPYAKLGSDMKKPNATTVIVPSNYEKTVWTLPVSDLLYVGPKTTEKFARRQINTIGDLANKDVEYMRHMLGKVGLMLRMFARGEDTAPVMSYEAEAPAVSIGNSTTTPVDMLTASDVKCVFTLLAESVTARMREQGYRARCVHIHVRQANGLNIFGGQKTIKFPTCSTLEFVDVAMGIFYDKKYDGLLPFRSIGISCSALTPRDAPTQMDLFGDEQRRVQQEKLEDTIYWLKQRYGQKAIEIGTCSINKRLREINTKEDDKYHQIASAYHFGEGVKGIATGE